MSRDRDTRGLGVDGFPRVSGDEPPYVNINANDYVFSPRERG